MAIVYLITHVESGKAYVGKTIQPLHKRWKAHVSVASQGRGRYLAAAIRKYGPGAFTIKTIEVCASDASALIAEVKWIATLQTKAPSGYNLTDGGEGHAGLLHTEEWKQRRSEAMKASPPRDPAIGKKISAALKGRPSTRRGIRYSDEVRARMADSHKGQIAHNKGKPMSDEQKAKLSAAMSGRGHAHSEETKEKIRRANTGAVFTDERKAKIGAATRARAEARRAERESLAS